MALSFGTDGVRGHANVELTPAFALALGRAAARVLDGDQFLIGRDTRRSGPMLEAAIAAGLAAEGRNVALLGVLPTPGVSWASARRGLPGVVISASHNPFYDNGIKLFSSTGRKLSDANERAMEAELSALIVGSPGATGTAVGFIETSTSATTDYCQSLIGSLEPNHLAGMRLVVDAANGAASALIKPVFTALGAQVEVINATPDGININDHCGATHVDALTAAVSATGADAGIALDGDADRCIAVGADGLVVDGDRLIGLCAIDRARRGLLPGNTVVVTVMTNLGFHHAMRRAGIEVVQTGVGDRSVLEALARGGYGLGGEQSGHVIFPALASTGDGMLTALQLLDAVTRAGRPLHELAAEVMERLPQQLVNVSVSTAAMSAVVDGLEAQVSSVTAALGERGRVLVRASGTEPLLRIMAEAATQAEADQLCHRLADAAKQLAASAR